MCRVILEIESQIHHVSVITINRLKIIFFIALKEKLLHYGGMFNRISAMQAPPKISGK